MIVGKTASEIFDNIRHLVQSGVLKPGDVLPPVRELAGKLSVNRNTVAAAYKRLVTSGLAISQGRNGTAIKTHNTLPALEGGDPSSPLKDISSGNPDPTRLANVKNYLSAIAAAPRLYGDAAVDPRLAAWAHAWMSKDSGVDAEINLASGAIDALERLLCALLLPGDSVAIEDPCFLSSINMLRYAGFTPSPVPVDAEGMQPDALEEALRNGARAIRDILARYPQVLVIIDDHFALLSSTPWHSPLAAESRRWALVRSLSKTLGPDMRLAIVASDCETSAALRLRLNSGSQWVSHLLQDLVIACLNDDAFMASLTESRRHYRRQHEKLIAALARCGITHLTPGDGLNFWFPLEEPSQPVALRLAHAGWLVREGETFGIRTPSHGLRLSLATLSDEEINKLSSDLCQILQQQ